MIYKIYYMEKKREFDKVIQYFTYGVKVGDRIKPLNRVPLFCEISFFLPEDEVKMSGKFTIYESTRDFDVTATRKNTL